MKENQTEEQNGNKKNLPKGIHRGLKLQDLIIVLIGVLVTLGYTIGNKQYTDYKTRKNLINELRTSLKEDIKYIDYVLAVADTITYSLDNVFSISEYSEKDFSKLNDEYIDTLVHYTSHSLGFRPNMSVFEAYKYNGDLKLLESKFLTKLFYLYDYYYVRIFCYLESNQSVISQIDNYLVDNAKYIGRSKYSYSIKADKETLKNLLKDEKYKQLLNINGVTVEMLIFALTTAKEEIEKLMILLDDF